MSTEIQEFDLTTAIRNRVRGVIIDAIPDEQVDEMIRAEFQGFFKERKVNYGRDVAPSRFAELIKKHIEALLNEKIREWLDKNFDQVWSDDDCELLVGEMVGEFTPIVQKKMAADIVSRALFEFKNTLNNFR